MEDPKLDEIIEKAQNIKCEPEEIQEPTYEEDITITPFEPPEPPRFLTNYFKQDFDSPDIVETDIVHERAQPIQRREALDQNANIPPKPTPIISQPTESRLTVSAYNHQYRFQATPGNVPSLKAYPNSHIPLVVQETARRTGVNSRDPRLQKKTVPIEVPQRPQTNTFLPPAAIPVNVQKSRDAASLPVIPPKIPRIETVTTPALPKIPTVEKKNAQTQTTKNDGTLSFELTQDEVMNLSNEKKQLLLKFKEVIFYTINFKDLI